MPPSKQTIINRRNDVARLQESAPPPLVIGDDGRRYTVSSEKGILFAARYEVVAAWLTGYAHGRLAREEFAQLGRVAGWHFTDEFVTQDARARTFALLVDFVEGWQFAVGGVIGSPIVCDSRRRRG